MSDLATDVHDDTGTRSGGGCTVDMGCRFGVLSSWSLTSRHDCGRLSLTWYQIVDLTF
jgi:hypothetical protein